MKTLLGHGLSRVEEASGVHTAREILQQPEIWLETYQMIGRNKERIGEFLNRCMEKDNLRIVLSGAGSSAFVGECAQVYLNKLLDRNVEIIATTDIVSHPNIHLKHDTPTLMVSYARSGNSPESVGAVKVANQVVSEISHLILTCNPSGELAKMSEDMDDALVLFMPEKANDQGFAMTGSFTSMLLSSLLVFNISSIDRLRPAVEDIVSMGIHVMENQVEELIALSGVDFNRIIYLGAATMKGMAQEAALKMLELTAGRVGTLFDSPLGFRHGPKSYIDSDTMVVMFFSNDEYARKYEMDLLREMKRDGIAKRIVAVCDKIDGELFEYSDVVFNLSEGRLSGLSDEYLNLPFLVIAQILAFNKSLDMAITPDNPSPSGVVNRVVQGVTLYAYQNEGEKANA